MSRWLTPRRLALAALLGWLIPLSPAAAADLFAQPGDLAQTTDRYRGGAVARSYSHVHDFPYWDLIRGPRWQDQDWRFSEQPCIDPAHAAWTGHTHHRSATAGRRNPNE